MYKLIVIVYLFFIAPNGYCQTLHTKYFNNAYLQKETTLEKAKYSQTTIQNPDGSVTTEIKDIRKNEIVSSETYKGDEPIGVWTYMRKNAPGLLDYSFSLIYSDTPCNDSIPGLNDYFENNENLKYIAPKILSSERTFYYYLSKNLVYPANAIEQGIQGKVYLTFTITTDAKIENIVVKKGVNILLDKEAIRVIRKLKLESAPIVNGQPKDVCVTLPLTFKLE